jgi:hydroxymethylglutaryl-CoA lyase
MVTEVLEAAARVLPAERTALHLHDTNGRALENVEVGLCMGIRSFDAACGGTGGCPFAPGAAGNLATERLVSFLHERGYETGVSLADLQPVATFLASRLRRPI